MFGPRAGKAPNPRALPIGGCDFVAEPDLDWRHTPVFWRADIADDVVCFLNVDPSLSSDFTGQDIEESALYRRAAQDGLYMNWLSGDQAWLLPPVRLDLPIVAASPLDGSFPRRTAAAVRIWRRTRGQPSTKAPGPSLRRRDYLTRALRALCGRLAGASHREVATVLLGGNAVPSGSAWKTSDARSLILRLADTGRRLSHGGYRSLLGRGSDFGTS